jgi:hypothetical protein
MILDRINISKILKAHIKTLYDYRESEWSGKKKMSKADISIFIILPIILAAFFVSIGMMINNFYINLIITSLSIFVALLFSFLTLVYQIVIKKREQFSKDLVNKKQEIKYRLVKELFVNIAFSIALSIMCIVAILLTRFNPLILTRLLSKISFYKLIRTVYLDLTNFISYFLIIEFVFLLLMILKRFFIVFESEFSET